MKKRIPEVQASFDALAGGQRPPGLRVGFESPLKAGEMVVDNFAGGGGASCGLEAAIGRPVDLAINHNPQALALHMLNHPETRHHCEDLWDVDPVEACAGRPVGLAWFSPDCTHFSRAKGATPLEKKIRGLAWIVIRWAKAVRPRIIVLENVAEFRTWGPLRASDNRPDPAHAGETFREWVSSLRQLGYAVEWRDLAAHHFGVPTTRERMFLVARCDGEPITWPAPTHEDGEYRTASEIIDWTIPCPSIFERKRPLAEATMKRIAVGLKRFVLDAGEPFIVRHGHYSKRTGAGLIPGRGAGTWRGQSIHKPLATVCATNDKNLVSAWVVKHYGGVYGHGMGRPIGTITGRDHHGLAMAFLTKYYGNAATAAQDVRDPLHTITSKARFGLVESKWGPVKLLDIGMRMLQPRELYNAQGFPSDYRIDCEIGGKPITKELQIMMVGNSVCPGLAEAVSGENVKGGR